MKLQIFSAMLLIAIICFAGLAHAKVHKAKSKDGVEIAYLVEGKGAITLLFVHGWCCDKSYWREQIPVFAKQYQVVALDLAGHGESGLSRTTWSMEAFALDVVAVVNAVKPKKVILIGHSMGGGIIVEAAKLLQGKVIGLIGVDTLHNVEEKYSHDEYEKFAAPVRKDFVKGSEPFIRSMFTTKSDPALIEKIVKDMSSCPPQVGLGAWNGLFSYDLASAMDKIKVPIRCINADKYPTNLEANKRHAVSFDVKFMKGWGHFIMLEDPQTFNKLLAETIQEF